MSPTLDAFLRSWPSAPWLVAALVLTAGVYLRGWLLLQRRDPRRWHAGQLAAFVGGLAALFLALASPVEPFAVLFLQVHMLQHLLLMMVAPPLVWLGEPLFPLLRSLPRPVRIYWVAPLFRSPLLRRLFGRLTHPAWALALFVGATWLWHVPVLYELALRSDGWHYLQHACFLGTGLLFWYPVVRPYPSRPRWSAWLLLPYLLAADVQNTILSALLTFSSHLWYPYYAEVPRLGGVSALDDQAAAGVLMWVPGSIAFLLPLFWIAIQLLYGREADRRPRGQPVAGRIPLPLVSAVPPPFDVLRVPVLGRFLRWRHARLALQLPLAVLAALLILDGLRGPQVGAMNLAGVLPWIHWRGLVILGLLAAGNVFCMACPFLLPRTIARRWLPARWHWPRPLRNKGPAVLLLVLFLWAYEAFALWDSPWWTAWLALGYFTAPLVIDGLFRGAAFCKYVCPVGQFNFVQSLVSPLEVKVRDPEVCASCRTRDCIRGRPPHPPRPLSHKGERGSQTSRFSPLSPPWERGGGGVRGCELHLFQPRKAGNMDCTFCLDCVHACPHDNVGLLAGAPGRGLWDDSFRSGVGRFGKRPDLAALVLVLVFGAFANAAGMTGPVQQWQDALRARCGLHSPFLVVTLFYALVLLVLPPVLAGAAATLARWCGGLKASRLDVATRYSFALVPLGFGMWLAHYSFHFLGSYDAVVPVTQRFAADHGWTLFGMPEWACACCRPVAAWLPRLEILCLDVGLLLSLYVAYRISLAVTEGLAAALKALAPWGLLLVLLFAAGVWIVLQPMQMRGTMTGAG
jgi:cytochrome c oxidase assembly factor CtaG